MSNMELKEFVKNILIEIDEAISDARTKTDRDISFSKSNDEKRTVEFDIAVTVENEKVKSGGGGIKVFSAEIGGKLNSVNKNSTVSRISFGVDIESLTKEEEKIRQDKINARLNRSRINSQLDSSR